MIIIPGSTGDLFFLRIPIVEKVVKNEKSSYLCTPYVV